LKSYVCFGKTVGHRYITRMDPLDDIILKRILKTDKNGVVLQPEDDKIEYKLIFNNQSKETKAKYVKELAALYNFEGGYLIFGVNDKTLEMEGLQNFSLPDNADLSNVVNTYFSPAIRFQTKELTFEGKKLFIIFVKKRDSIPTVCIKSYRDVLTVATIYWRYSAQSAPIKAGDLINLLNALKGENTRELAKITEKNYRSKFKPRISATGGHSPGNVRLTLQNKGEPCYLDDFNVIEGDEVLFRKWQSEVELAKEGSIQLSGTIKKTYSNRAKFIILIEYHDLEKYHYQTKIEWDKGKARVLETVELE